MRRPGRYASLEFRPLYFPLTEPEISKLSPELQVTQAAPADVRSQRHFPGRQARRKPIARERVGASIGVRVVGLCHLCQLHSGQRARGGRCSGDVYPSRFCHPERSDLHDQECYEQGNARLQGAVPGLQQLSGVHRSSPFLPESAFALPDSGRQSDIFMWPLPGNDAGALTDEYTAIPLGNSNAKCFLTRQDRPIMGHFEGQLT